MGASSNTRLKVSGAAKRNVSKAAWMPREMAKAHFNVLLGDKKNEMRIFGMIEKSDKSGRCVLR